MAQYTRNECSRKAGADLTHGGRLLTKAENASWPIDPNEVAGGYRVIRKSDGWRLRSKIELQYLTKKLPGREGQSTIMQPKSRATPVCRNSE